MPQRLIVISLRSLKCVIFWCEKSLHKKILCLGSFIIWFMATMIARLKIQSCEEEKEEANLLNNWIHHLNFQKNGLVVMFTSSMLH